MAYVDTKRETRTERDSMGEMEVPADAYQTGSGTSTNPNFIEVIATLATQRIGDGTRVHPNDDVDRCQSSNDTVPTAIQLSVAMAISVDLLPALEHLQAALEAKSAQ